MPSVTTPNYAVVQEWCPASCVSEEACAGPGTSGS